MWQQSNPSEPADIFFMDTVIDFKWEKLPTAASNELLSDGLRDDDRWLPETVVKFLPEILQQQYNENMDELEVVEMDAPHTKTARKSVPSTAPGPMYKKVS